MSQIAHLYIQVIVIGWYLFILNLCISAKAKTNIIKLLSLLILETFI